MQVKGEGGNRKIEKTRWLERAECSYITPVHFLSLSLWRSTRAKSGWAKPLLPYIQPKQQITDCPSNPMHQGMCHCHHAPTTQSPCSHRHHACCSASCAPPPPHLYPLASSLFLHLVSCFLIFPVYFYVNEAPWMMRFWHTECLSLLSSLATPCPILILPVPPHPLPVLTSSWPPVFLQSCSLT